MFFSMDGNDGVYCTTGPLAGSARDVNLFMSAVRSTNPAAIDPSLIPIPYSIPVLPPKLRIGIMMNDGVVIPQPPILRGLEMVKAKLAKIPSVELVEYKPFEHDEGYDIIVSLSFASMSVA
jgi:amidase